MRSARVSYSVPFVSLSDGSVARDEVVVERVDAQLGFDMVQRAPLGSIHGSYTYASWLDFADRRWPSHACSIPFPLLNSDLPPRAE